MCGICGFNFENKSLLKKMCDLVAHRGPDDVGYYADSVISMGIRRLSIIDLNTGHQPQHNENEDIWIVFNGEIFNFIELKSDLESKGHTFYTKSDTEVIIHAYEEWDRDCVKKLRGQFAFCIYDSRKKILFLSRDHLGIKPLYYYFDNKRFIFGSEIKCILCHDIKREINRKAFDLYLSLSYVPFDITLFKGIYKIPAASYLIFNLKTDTIEIKNYMDFIFNINRRKGEEQLANELRDLLIDSVKSQLISDVPLGAFLSGGIDSSSIVGIMSMLTKDPIKTYSVGFEEGAPINELEFAKRVAEYFGTDHHEIIVKSSSYELLPELIWFLDDLIADAGIIPEYIMAKKAREKITVALTGDGADEVFAGYSVYYRRQKNDVLSFLPKKSIDFMMKFYKLFPSYGLRNKLYYYDQSKKMEDRYIRRIIEIPDVEKFKIVPFDSENVKSQIKNKLGNNLDIVNRFTYWDLKYQLPNQFNMKVDKMTMAASIEVRTPFLDKELVDWSLTIPSELKLKGTIEKYILRLAMKDILPSEILKRKKCGFSVPINLWFEMGLKSVSEEILQKLKKRKDLLKSNYLTTMKKRNSKIFWNLIMFELWYETFIENNGLKPIKF